MFDLSIHSILVKRDESNNLNKLVYRNSRNPKTHAKEHTEEDFAINVAPAEEAEGPRDLERELRVGEKVEWMERNLGGIRVGEESEGGARRRVMESGQAWTTASIERRREREIAGSDKSWRDHDISAFVLGKAKNRDSHFCFNSFKPNRFIFQTGQLRNSNQTHLCIFCLLDLQFVGFWAKRFKYLLIVSENHILES